MNRTFRTVFNALRGQIVVVSERAAAHSQASGKGVRSTRAVVGPRPTRFLPKGLAIAIAGALGLMAAAQPQASVLNPADWAAEENVISDPDMTTLDTVLDATGGYYGPVESWSGWIYGNKLLISVTNTGGITEGRLGSSGRLLHWGIINSGAIVDQETLTGRPDGLTQNFGSSNWITKFANTADGTLKVYDLRSTEVQNASEHFEVAALHLREGGTLENLAGGIMNIGDLRAGVADASVFESYGVTLTEDNSALSLPDVTYSTGTATRVVNTGTMNVGHAHIAGTFTNSGLFTTAEAGAGESSLGAAENSGTLDLAADARFASLTQTGAASALKGAVNVTVEGGLTNQGKIGENSSRIARLTAEGEAVNSGTIYAAAASFTTLTNQAGGTVDVSGELSVAAGGSVSNSGSVSANWISASSGSWVNEAGSSLEVKGNGAGTFATLSNQGTANLDCATHTGSGEVTAQTIINSGSLFANDLSTGTLSTTGDITARGTLEASSLTTVSSAAAEVTAANFVLSGLSSKGTVTETGTGSSSFGAVTNGGTINLAHATTIGSLTNTLEGVNGTVAGSAELTVSGALQNAGAIGNDELRLAKLTVGGTAENAGSIYAEQAAFNAGLTNRSTVVTAGAMTVAGALVNTDAVTAGGRLTLSGTGSSNSGVINADAAGMTVSGSISNSNIVNAGAGVTVSSGGVFTTSGGTVRTNVLDVQTGGTFVNASNTGATATILSLKGAGTLENSADLLLGSIDAVNSAGMTYRQTAGTVTVADGTWFEGASLSIEGGKLIRTDALGNTLGANDVTISGTNSTAFTGGSQLTGDWRSSYTYVHVGELNSEASVKLDAGGVLEADSINLTAATLTFSGGALAGSLSSLFDTVTQTVYTIDTGDEHHLTSEILGATDVGDVKTAFADNAQWDAEGGAFVITDEYVSLAAITRAGEKLSEAANGNATAVVYTGTLPDIGAASEYIYHDDFGNLRGEQDLQSGSKFTNPGVVFASMIYSNKLNEADDASLDHVVIGTSGTVAAGAQLIDRSIGFRKVENASQVTVQDGKIFTLTGSCAQTADELVGGPLGEVSVEGAGSLFNFGSMGVAGTKGHLGTLTVADGGSFRAVRGTYGVDTLTLTEGAGKVLSTADLTVSSYSDSTDAQLENEGSLTLVDASAVNGSVTNRAELEVQSDTVLSGGLTNTAGGTAVFQALMLTSGLTNDFGSKITVSDGLTVESTVTAGSATSTGRLVSIGDNLIRGALTVGKTSETEFGQMVAQGATTVRGGSFTVQGDALLGTVKALTGTLAVGEGGLLYAEGNDGISTGIMATFSAGANSTVAAKTFNVLGVNRINESAKLRIGKRAMSEVDAARLAALKGTDWTDPSVQTASTFALRLASAQAADERIYDAGTTTFTSTLPGGTYRTDQYFGGNDVVDNVAISGTVSMTDDAALILGNNIFVTQGATLTLGEAAKLDVQDWVDPDTDEVWQANLIVRGGTVNMGGSSVVRSLVVADGNYTVTGADNASQPADGSLLTLTGGTYTVETGGTADWSCGSASETGTAVVNGTFHIGETFELGGSMTGTGRVEGTILTVAETGTLNVAELGLTKLVNAGSTTIAEASQFGAANTYVHMGNAALTISDGQWFSGTNIVYDGGAVIETTDLRADGTLGANTVTIQREGSGYGPQIIWGTPNTATFDGMTTVHVTTLTDETYVAVYEGGRLIVDALSGSADALVEGGVLDIALGDVIATLPDIDGILIDAESPADTDSVNSGVISNPNGISFDGTKLAGITFNDAVVNLRSDSTNTLATLAAVTQGLSGFGSATAIYNGDVAGAVENTFDVAQIQQFIEEQQNAGSVAADPGLVLSQYSLKVTNGDTVNWTLDDATANALKGSIGFADIIGVNEITVGDGLTASLTGQALAAGEDFDWSDGNRLLKGDEAGVGGVVTVEADGSMVFGSNGTPQVNTGWIDQLTTNGRTEITNFMLGVKEADFLGETVVKSTGWLLVGTAAADETTEIGGTFLNQGAVDMAAVETVSVTGELTNAADAGAKYRDMTIADGGESINIGHEEGRYLTISDGAVHTNTGVSIWEQVDVLEGGKAVMGSEAADESSTIGGIYANHGTIDASKAELVIVSGQLVNYGHADWMDLNLVSTAESMNAEYEKGNILTVEGTHTNTGTSIWNGVKMNGGTLVVDGDGDMEASTATVEAGSTIDVRQGVLALQGMTVSEARSFTEKDAVLGLKGSLNVEGSRMTIGTVAEGDLVNMGDVYFGSDSALALDTVGLTGDKAISGSGKVTVKDGSNLVVTNASWGRHVIVTDGLNTEQTDDGAWQGVNLVNRTDKDLAVEVKDTQIILKAGANPDDPVEPPVDPTDPSGPDEPVVPPVNPDGPATDIGSLSGDYLAPDVINGLIDTDEGAAIRDVNSPYADVAIIDRMLEKAYAGETADGKLDVARSVKVLNSVIGFNGATGADAYSISRVTDRMDHVEAHAQDDRQLESGLWVDIIGGIDRIDGLSLDGKGSTGYKADTYGFLMGGDTWLNRQTRIGGAFTYVRGDLDSKGDYLPVSSDADTFGLTVYGAHDVGNLRISGHAGLDFTKADSTMSFADAMGNGYSVKGESGSQTVSFGVRADYTFSLAELDLVPHIGFRYAHTWYDNYDTSINGAKAFTNRPDGTDLVQIPVGFTVKGTITANGWSLKPAADFTVMPQFGDTDHRVEVLAANYFGRDSYSHEVAGDVVGKVTLGLEAEENRTHYGVTYAGTVGDAGKSAHALKFSVRHTF